ncbi:MAG: hypothetical protein AAFR76_01480 [Planctomycetota bacterium]
MLLTLDAIAKRRGCFVFEVLQLSPFQLGLELQCLDAAIAHQNRRMAVISTQHPLGVVPTFAYEAI